MTTITFKPLSRQHAGFTLIEILIGMIIGLLGIVVMFQVLSLWESLKRTTAAGSDAQIAGTVALFALERDLRESGMGFSRVAEDQVPKVVPSIGCTVSAKAPVASFRFVPVEIIDGVSGAPDQIITLYGNSSLYVSTQKFKASTSSAKTVDGSYGGFKVGDVVVAGGGPLGAGATIPTVATAFPCEMFEVASVATPGELGHSTALRFNPAPSQTALTEGFLYNLGPLPQRNVWSVGPTANPQKLLRQEGLYAAAPVEAADNIINLQAQYGIDGFGGGNATDGRLDDGDWTATTPTTQEGWSRVLAIRVALLSRSQQFEKMEVTDGGAGTAPAPDWAGGAFAMTNIAGTTGDEANWKRYRYRVYETVIPLRNIVWGGSFN